VYPHSEQQLKNEEKVSFDSTSPKLYPFLINKTLELMGESNEELTEPLVPVVIHSLTPDRIENNPWAGLGKLGLLSA
jgi:hypothetical protein